MRINELIHAGLEKKGISMGQTKCRYMDEISQYLNRGEWILV